MAVLRGAWVTASKILHILVWTSLSRSSDYPASTQLFGCALKLYSQMFTYPNRGRSQICEGLLYIIDSMQQCRCVLRFFYTSYPQTPNKIRCALNGIPWLSSEIIPNKCRVWDNQGRTVLQTLDCPPPPRQQDLLFYSSAFHVHLFQCYTSALVNLFAQVMQRPNEARYARKAHQSL